MDVKGHPAVSHPGVKHQKEAIELACGTGVLGAWFVIFTLFKRNEHKVMSSTRFKKKKKKKDTCKSCVSQVTAANELLKQRVRGRRRQADGDVGSFMFLTEPRAPSTPPQSPSSPSYLVLCHPRGGSADSYILGRSGGFLTVSHSPAGLWPPAGWTGTRRLTHLPTQTRDGQTERRLGAQVQTGLQKIDIRPEMPTTCVFFPSCGQEVDKWNALLTRDISVMADQPWCFSTTQFQSSSFFFQSEKQENRDGAGHDLKF